MLGSAIFGSLTCGSACFAQASGGSADVLSYSLSAGESLSFGYNGANGASNSLNIGGNAAYVSSSENHPLSFVYSGGYVFGNNGQPSASFQNLGISQVLNTRRWTFLVSDVVSYLPATPRFGIAGVPGIGDIGTSPIGTGIVPGDSLLTNFGRRLTNTVVGGATVKLTARDSIRNSGVFTKQYFLDGNGIENNQLIASSEFDHSFTQATTVGGGYTYSRAMYPGSSLSFVSQSLVGTVQHTFNPRFNVSGSIGPQWTKGSNTTLVPSRTGISISAGASYALRHDSYSAGFTHGTSTGSGVLYGALSNNFTLSAQHQFSDQWSAGLFVSYGSAKALASQTSALYTSTSSVATGIQANRRLGDRWSVYGSYAAQFQDVSQLQATNNAFNGTANIITFGVSYSPRPIHLGRRR